MEVGKFDKAEEITYLAKIRIAEEENAAFARATPFVRATEKRT